MSPRVAQRVRKVKPRKVNRAFGRLHWRSSPTHKKKQTKTRSWNRGKGILFICTNTNPRPNKRKDFIKSNPAKKN
jgi:hypothetical protein